jgi:DNA-binding transcriptional LysR family regulator
MLGYARRLLDLNDEVLGRLTATDYTGQITLGVPHDIVYPAIPQVLQRFNTDFPRMRVQLVSSYTSRLKAMFARGESRRDPDHRGRGQRGGRDADHPLAHLGRGRWRAGLETAAPAARLRTQLHLPPGFRMRSTGPRSPGKWRWRATPAARWRPPSPPIWPCMPASRAPNRPMWSGSTTMAGCRTCRRSGSTFTGRNCPAARPPMR